MKQTKKNQKGFTLTELIVVIVIIGILAAVLIPTLTSYINRSRKSAAERTAMTFYKEWPVAETHGKVLVSDDEMTALVELKYIVYVGGYSVTIEQGALAESVKLEDGETFNSNGYVEYIYDSAPNPLGLKQRLTDNDQNNDITTIVLVANDKGNKVEKAWMQ